jgi:hypothetical protein
MKNSEKFYYLLYIILNFLSYFVAIIYRLKLIVSFSSAYYIIQFISSCLSLYTLKKTRNNPGYVTKESEISINEAKEIKPEVISIYDPLPIMNINLMPSNGCEICGIIKLPLRSHHCSQCKRCVKCFDHHCWILAGCIGENNRFIFNLFLLCQNISMICSAFSIIKIINRQDNEVMNYLLTLLFSIICLIEVIFFWIMVFQIYLLLTNQTTYEIFNEDQCPYLSIFSFERKKILNLRGISTDDIDRFQPFNSGIKNNVYLFINKMVYNDYIIQWDKIYFYNLKSKSKKQKHKTIK